ncbi:MAG: sugar ABC transporter substrate-binding protein [Rectinemataceae bacterium]
MKKMLVVLAIAVVGIGSIFANGTQEKPAAKFAWYVPAPHPYFDSVKQGVMAFAKENGIDVKMQVGPDWNMDSENTGVLALAAQGYNYFSIYPIDPSAANGLYKQLVAHGVKVINFGATTFQPTTASLAFMTDVKAEAETAAKYIIGKMGGQGTLLNVLEVLADPNTQLRKQGVDEVVAQYPGIKLIEVAGINSEQEAMDKINGAIAGAGGYVNGIICTGWVPSVAMAKIITDYQQKYGKRIDGVGIDNDPVVLKAVKDGFLDGTYAQNYYGHGYLPFYALKLMSEGYKPMPGVYNISTGQVLITKDNVDNYMDDLAKLTATIKSDMTTKYLTK